MNKRLMKKTAEVIEEKGGETKEQASTTAEEDSMGKSDTPAEAE